MRTYVLVHGDVHVYAMVCMNALTLCVVTTLVCFNAWRLVDALR